MLLDDVTNTTPPGEDVSYTKVGIPYRLERDEATGELSNAQYDFTDKPPRIAIKEHPCTQYYHGHCFNSLFKMICRSDVKQVEALLKCRWWVENGDPSQM